MPSVLKENKLKIPNHISSYSIQELIYEGSSSSIYKVINGYTNTLCVAKVISKSYAFSNIVLINKELYNLKLLKHKSILALYEIIETQTSIWFITEYCTGSNLFDYIYKRKHLTEMESLNIFQQLITALSYIHSMHIAHRDIRPENIMIDSNGSIKLIDFHLSTIYDDDDDESNATPKPKPKLLNGSLSSQSYSCPEMIDTTSIGYSGMKCDVYSCGVLLYVMICGFLPFCNENEEENKALILKGDYIFPKQGLSKEIKDLIEHMMDINPDTRYTFDQIMHHPWLQLSTSTMVTGFNLNTHHYPIDSKIIMLCLQFGFDKQKTINELLNNKYTIRTAVYKQIVKHITLLEKESISDLFSSEYKEYISDKENQYDESKSNLNERTMLLNEDNLMKKIQNDKRAIDLYELGAIIQLEHLISEYRDKNEDSSLLISGKGSIDLKHRRDTKISNELYLKRRNNLRRDAKINVSDIFIATQLYGNKSQGITNNNKSTSSHESNNSQSNIATDVNDDLIRNLSFGMNDNKNDSMIEEVKEQVLLNNEDNIYSNEGEEDNTHFKYRHNRKVKSHVKILLYKLSKARDKSTSVKRNITKPNKVTDYCLQEPNKCKSVLKDLCINSNRHKGILNNSNNLLSHYSINERNLSTFLHNTDRNYNNEANNNTKSNLDNSSSLLPMNHPIVLTQLANNNNSITDNTQAYFKLISKVNSFNQLNTINQNIDNSAITITESNNNPSNYLLTAPNNNTAIKKQENNTNYKEYLETCNNESSSTRDILFNKTRNHLGINANKVPKGKKAIMKSIINSAIADHSLHNPAKRDLDMKKTNRTCRVCSSKLDNNKNQSQAFSALQTEANISKCISVRKTCRNSNNNYNEEKTSLYTGPIDLCCISPYSLQESIEQLRLKMKKKYILFSMNAQYSFCCNKNGFYFEIKIVELPIHSIKSKIYYYLFKKKQEIYGGQINMIKELLKG